MQCCATVVEIAKIVLINKMQIMNFIEEFMNIIDSFLAFRNKSKAHSACNDFGSVFTHMFCKDDQGSLLGCQLCDEARVERKGPDVSFISSVEENRTFAFIPILICQKKKKQKQKQSTFHSFIYLFIFATFAVKTRASPVIR